MERVPGHRTHLRLLPSLPNAAAFQPADGKRRSVERAMHQLTLIAAQSVATEIPEAHRDWWYDLRRKNQSVCAAAFRFIDFLHRLGFPRETAMLIPAWIAAYVVERYGTTPPNTGAMPLTLLVTGENDKAVA